MTAPRRLLRDDNRRWIALVVVCFAQFMNMLDTAIVNVALPSIRDELDLDQAGLAWVVDAYLIAFGSFLLLAGRLGDLVGRKRVFLSGVLLFTAASVACGLAQDGDVLVVARFVQGLGSAVSASVILAIVVTEFPIPTERAKAMSAYMFVVIGGASIGLLVGGVVAHALDWHWIFFINVPIGALVLVAGFALLEESEARGLDRSVDVLGSVLVTVAAMLAVYAVVRTPEEGWLSGPTLGVAGAAAALLVAFLVLESRLANPIMPLRILRVRGLIGSSVVRGFLVTAMFGTFFLGALYVARVLRYDSLETGLAFLPLTLAMAALSLGPTARLVARFGPLRVSVVGAATTALGLVGLALWSTESASYFPSVAVPFVILGIGSGLAFMPLLTLALADVPPHDAGLASGIVNVSMQLAGALGLAGLSAVAADRTQTLRAAGDGTMAALTGGYRLAFWIGAACIAIGVAVALAVLRDPAPVAAAVEPEAQAA